MEAHKPQPATASTRWSYALAHLGSNEEDKRCIECHLRAAYLATVTDTRNGSKHVRIYCLNHGAAYAHRNGIVFPPVRGSSA